MSNYISKNSDPYAFSINFFATIVPNCCLFVYPPVHLIGPALKHLEKFKSFGCFIIPYWKSSFFSTFICSDGVHFNRYVHSFLFLSPNFNAGQYIRNRCFKGIQKFITIALAFNFSLETPFESRICKKFCTLDGCEVCFNRSDFN